MTQAPARLGLLLLGSLFLNTACAHEDASSNPRTISVNGQAEVQARPDQAMLNVAVDEVAKDVASAEAVVNAVVGRFLKRARELGAGDRDLQAPGLQVQPEYEWDEKTRKRHPVGYRVSREVTVRITELAKLGDYIQGATGAGMNRIQPPRLGVQDEDKLSQQALELAADDARVRAELLAKRLGAKLGPVRNISVQDFHRPQPVMMEMAVRSKAADGGMPVEAGELDVRANVHVVFDLIAK